MFTTYEKTDAKLISYRIPGTKDLTQFTTTGDILCHSWQRHMVLNVETDTKNTFPSDHFPMIATIKIEMVGKRNEDNTRRNKYNPPTGREHTLFNEAFKTNCTGADMLEGSSEIAIGKLQDYIKRAEETSLTMIRRKKRTNKTYIYDKPATLLSKDKKARDEKDDSKEIILHEKSKGSVKQGKRDFWAQQLEKNTGRKSKVRKSPLFQTTPELSTWAAEWPYLTKYQMFWQTSSNKFNGAE